MKIYFLLENIFESENVFEQLIKVAIEYLITIRHFRLKALRF